MSSPGQILVILVIYVLSFTFLRFLRRWVGGRENDGADAEAAPQAETASQADTVQESRFTSIIQCGVCGAENDTDFTYCKNCLADLDSAQPRSAMV